MNRIPVYLVAAVLMTFIIITIVDMFLVGVVTPYFSFKKNKGSFIIQTPNRFEMQSSNECSGYSSAYLLRHFGIEADGLAVYEKMPDKMANGYVYPKEVKRMLESYGIKTRFSVATLKALKTEIDRGNPVIVLIRIRPDKDWLHYVTVVGYDTENIYLAESLPEFVNSDNEKYNRVISTKEFLKLWNTSMLKMPLYRHIMYSKK